LRPTLCTTPSTPGLAASPKRAQHSKADAVTVRITLDDVLAKLPDWKARGAEFAPLRGGLAHESYLATVNNDRFVVKLLTDDMVRYHLMIPHKHLLHNTWAAGESGVGAKLVESFPDISVMVLEYIDGRTLETGDLAGPGYVSRIAAALARLHSTAPRFTNEQSIFSLLDAYLRLTEREGLRLPDRYLDYLPTARRVQEALAIHALPLAPCNNDLLAANVMDGSDRIRIIDYDFSGMNDPCFELGDLAIEGRYTVDDVEHLCEAYFGARRPVQVARTRLFRIGAQFTWTLLFAAMDQVLDPKPDPDFDYWGEAELRWGVTLSDIEDPEFGAVLAKAQNSE
jgi:thiamine kinase-like enzyme